MARELTPNKKMESPLVERWEVAVTQRVGSVESDSGQLRRKKISRRWTLRATMNHVAFERLLDMLTKAGVSPPLDPTPSNVGVFRSVTVRDRLGERLVDFVFEAFQLPLIRREQLSPDHFTTTKQSLK
jgi:hypothetical protein